MARILKAMALALVIPAVALILIASAENRLEADWRASIIDQLGPQPDNVLDRARLTNLCRDPKIAVEIPSNCQFSGIAEVLKPAGYVGLGLSIALFVLILPLGALVRRNQRILALFRPGLRLLLLALVALVLINGSLVAGAAYLAESIYSGSVHPYVVFAIAVVVILAASGVLRAALTMGRAQPISVHGLVLDRDRDPRLFELVDDVATRVGATTPDQIVAGLDPTFFVTEGPVKAFDGTYRGRTLFLSIPFIRILSRSELVAVVGHELGHFRGADTVFSRKFYPVYRGSIQSLGVLQASARGWMGIPLLPPLRILELFFLSFVGTERRLSRDRELAADQVGAEASSATDIGVALIKMAAYQASWGDAYAETVTALRDQRSAGNVSTRFAQLAILGARPSHLTDVDHGRISHPTDSHPKTSERLAALDVDVKADVQRAMQVQPDDPASGLIDDVGALESDLMEDLEEELTGSVQQAEEVDPVNRSASIRSAALDDPAIAALIALEEPIRGPDLQPSLRAGQDWVVLADLDVRPHPSPTGFVEFVGAGPLPSGDQQLAVGVASARTLEVFRVKAGSPTRLVGLSLRAARQLGRTELMFNAGGRIVTIRLVGDWPIDHQLAGMFVVSRSDPLAGDDSMFRDRLTEVIAGLVERDSRRGDAPAG